MFVLVPSPKHEVRPAFVNLLDVELCLTNRNGHEPGLHISRKVETCFDGILNFQIAATPGHCGSNGGFSYVCGTAVMGNLRLE